MEEKKLYLDKDFSREDLALEATTNRTYLSRALNSRGLNFSRFIASFRVQHAIGLMWEPEYAETPLADIAEMSGFTSADALNRCMKKSAGLTSCALRKRIRDTCN